MNDTLARRVEDARFTTTRMRAGYRVDDVDEFLDRLVAALRDGSAAPAMVTGATFGRTRSSGYDEQQVDDFLDEVSLALGGQTAAARPRPEPPVSTSREEPESASTSAVGGVIEEQRGLLSRLFRRSD